MCIAYRFSAAAGIGGFRNWIIIGQAAADIFLVLHVFYIISLIFSFFAFSFDFD